MTGISNTSSPQQKIALFRSLFRGRTEVYPRRYENRRTGAAGYSPACGNEWVKGICEKPRIKCSDCLHQQWLPLTDQVVRQHLDGKDPRGNEFVIGIYPMWVDERCGFLAADFDGENWERDCHAFIAICYRLGIPAALERSRSGNGGHVWIFFKEAIPAAMARKLGSHVLTETMESHPGIGLRSYDRFFPNQDTLPRGGFGNLIALPLQKAARARLNSVFIDESLRPYPDQWAFLDSLVPMESARVEEIIASAEAKGRVVGVRTVPLDGTDEATPWAAPPSRRSNPRITGPMPSLMELHLGDQLYIPKAELPPSLRNALVRIAAFQNPEFYQAQAMRLSTYGKPRIISCAEDLPQHIGLPRGCVDEALELLRSSGIEVVLVDERFHGVPLDVTFTGTLWPGQEEAAEAMLAHDTGVLSATTAFGKTVLAAWLIARRGVNTLVLVHRRQLLEQWVERLSSFLGIPKKEIGRFGGGGKRLSGRVDVALIQSLVRKEVASDHLAEYGHLIVDECHHLSARSFELAARRAKARFVTGLSATVNRKDGHHPIIFMQCGPLRHRVDARQQAAQRPFTHEVWVRPTGFIAAGVAEEDLRGEFLRLCGAMVDCEVRNRMITEDVIEAVRSGRSPLVLTERTAHLETLEQALRPEVKHLITLRGGMGRKQLKLVLETLATIPPGDARVIIATGRFVGEGFDDARLDTLFLTMPVSWSGTVAQYAGRLHRLNDGKTSVRIHDYADLDVPMLCNMFNRRCSGYEAVGYNILLPGSALPGWPVEVPLPVGPAWKRDHAASIRRLLADGVDLPLARAFLHATEAPAPTAEGAARARSASEAFFFRRLESLPGTSGLFRLNAHLPIPFGDQGRMEVDFLSEKARLVIELDGGQHLGDEDAWRRDRRKDALLQSHGYLILRFLAADLGTRIDAILDSVLATLANRLRK